MSNDDDHGPKAGCNWNQCGLDERDACPFVKDDKPISSVPSAFGELPDSCRHEWRQYWAFDFSAEAYGTFGFYCIYCLTITQGIDSGV